MMRAILGLLAAIPLAALAAVGPAGAPAGHGAPQGGEDRRESPDEGLEEGNGGGPAAQEPVAPGAPFPALKLAALPPGALSVEPVDLGAQIGRRPIVFVYLRLGHEMSEEIYLEIEDFVQAHLADKVALYPVTFLGTRFELSELHERMRLLGFRRPVLLDEEHRIHAATRVRFVPNVSLVNAQGELSFADARSLLHPVRGEVTVKEAILMASRGERPPAKVLYPHYPANDLIGKPFVKMTLPEYASGSGLRVADFVEPGKVTALIYWSPRCRYTKLVMPAVVAAVKTFGGRQLNVLSVVRDGEDQEVRAFAEEQGMSFPIARNTDRRFSTKYRVISTPTLITIAPDGRIDGVFTSSRINFFAVLRARIEHLLSTAPAPAAGGTSG